MHVQFTDKSLIHFVWSSYIFILQNFAYLLWVVMLPYCVHFLEKCVHFFYLLTVSFLKAIYLFEYATSNILDNELSSVNLLFSFGNT